MNPIEKTSAEKVMLSLNEITVRFGRHLALDRLSLTINTPGVTVVLGRNGAGKSTLLRTAIGAQPIKSGSVRTLGLDPLRGRHRNAVRRRVGFVPDIPDAPGWMTLADWLRYLKPHYPAFDIERGLDLAKRFRLPADVPFQALSRGQAMLGMWFSAVAFEPELLLLDEPFGGLDPLARDEILRAVIDELRDTGRAVVLATHDLEMAARIADRVVFVEDGAVAFETDLSDFEEGAGSIPNQLRQRMSAASAAALEIS